MATSDELANCKHLLPLSLSTDDGHETHTKHDSLYLEPVGLSVLGDKNATILMFRLYFALNLTHWTFTG